MNVHNVRARRPRSMVGIGLYRLLHKTTKNLELKCIIRINSEMNMGSYNGFHTLCTIIVYIFGGS